MPTSQPHSPLARPVVKVLALVGLLALFIVPATALAAGARGHRSKVAHHGAPAQCKGKKGKSRSSHCGNKGGSKTGLVTLTDHATAFTVRAPRDFALTRTAKGVEKVFSKTRGAFVNYLLVASPAAPAKVAGTLIAQSKSTVVSSTQTPTSYTATLVHAGHRERFQVRQVAPGQLELIAWGVHKLVKKHNGKSKGKASHGKHPKRGHRALKASVAHAAAGSSLEPLLEQIAGTAHGGKAVTAPEENKANPVAPVALQSFTDSDHSATAQVPVGFNCAGSKGIIECLDTAHGGIEFGVGMPVCVPGSLKAYTAEHVPGESALCPAIAGYEEGTAAATTLWGPTLDRLINAGIAGVTLVSSKPVSFAGFNASFDLLRFTRNGVPWEAAMIAATTTATGSAEEWLFYYSDVSAPQSGASAYGQALAQSWASFNPSAAESQRLAESENDQKQTTQIIDEADAFRQEVIEESDENWDAYIRGTYELPGERIKGEIEEKTHEAIGKAKEEIEQLP